MFNNKFNNTMMKQSLNKKILLITFSGNADHQDIAFGMFEELYEEYNAWLMCIRNPKVNLKITDERVRFVDCPDRPGINKNTFKLKVLFNEIDWIKKEKFDVIFFETLHTWNLPIMISCKSRCKMFQMIHDVIPHKGDKSAKAVELMNRVVCRLSDYIVLVSKKYINVIIEKYHVSANRVKCVDMWRRFPKYTEPKYTGKILFFGRLNPYKGMDNLLKIVEQCPEIQFEVVGRADPQVENIIQELQKKDNVILKTEYVSDHEMSNIFINSDWIILPYNSATQSGVIVDAYRYSRPVIAYNVGAIAEQIEDGISGYLIPKNDINEFIAKLKNVVTMDRSKYEILTRNAYEFGINKYSANGAKHRFLQLLN